jgi:hypothetical protein
LVQKRAYAAQQPMFALPPKATSNATYWNIRFGPKADSETRPQHVRFTSTFSAN